MNKEDYFKYYIQGSDHYLIPRDIFEELFDEMSNWREEAKELNQKYLNAVADYETTMSELQELKKQLEEYQLQNIDLRVDIMIQKKAFPNKLIKDKTFYDLYNMPTYEDLLHQQKEFMNFLTEAINKLKLKQKTSNSAILKANIDLQVEVYSIVLSKYKEIIGDDK